MACDLKQIGAGALKPPTITLPSITRPDLSNITSPKKSDQSELQECFGWTTPFGVKLLPPLPMDGLQGHIADTLKLGLDAIGKITTALVPMEVITKFMEPIEAALSALDGLTAIADVIEGLVDLATELAALLTTITGTYPLLLLAEILIMIDKICEVVSEMKEFLTAIVSVMDQIVSGIGDIASDITSQISDKVFSATSAVTGAVSSIGDRKESFDDTLNTLLDKNTGKQERYNAFIGTVVGGAPKLAADGLTKFSNQVVSEPFKVGTKKLKSAIVGDPEKGSKGIRGGVQTYFDSHADGLTFFHKKVEDKLGIKSKAGEFKFAQAEIRLNNELPNLEGCLEAALQGLGDLAGTYLTGAQELVENVAQSAIENLTGILGNVAIPLLDAIPECP